MWILYVKWGNKYLANKKNGGVEEIEVSKIDQVNLDLSGQIAQIRQTQIEDSQAFASTFVNLDNRTTSLERWRKKVKLKLA